MAVLLSGDGGWADIDRTIAEDLQRDGVPVVGWDSLHYFWRKKTPDRLAADLASVITTYLERWHAARVLLVGYSFGADVLPFAYNRLPEALRRQVVLVALLAVEPKTNFEVSVEGWLLLPASGDASPLAPEVAQIPPQLMLCVYGAEEKHTACPDFAATHGVPVVRTAGAHHFDGNYAALEKLILKAAGR
jgi:type IV secretory pathway VirJ component